MYSRSELEYKLKVRDARLGFRVVALSIAMIIPVWMGAYVAARMGYKAEVDAIAAPVGIVLLICYFGGVIRIMLGSGKETEVVCPKCGVSLGLSLKKVLQTGACPKCNETIVNKHASLI